MQDAKNVRKPVSTLSIKRYDDILRRVKDIVKDDNMLSEIDRVIRDVMLFDPTDTTYIRENSKKRRQKQIEKALNQGVSLYEMLGFREAYQRKKEKTKQTKQQI